MRTLIIYTTVFGHTLLVKGLVRNESEEEVPHDTWAMEHSNWPGSYAWVGTERLNCTIHLLVTF